MLSVQLLKCLLSGLVVGGMLTLMSSSEAASPLVGTMKRIDGSSQDLSAYQGKVVLVVNVASQCGYTSQYAGLQKLYERYKDKGLVILGFPANDFGAQEPGSDGEIMINGRVANRHANGPECFKHPARQVRGTWVDHRIVISKRHLTEQFVVVVPVERPPAAVAVLHGSKPLPSPGNRSLDPGPSRGDLHGLPPLR